MHVSIGMSSAAFMVYLSVDVCVCVCVYECVWSCLCTRACEQQLEKCSGDKKNYFLQLVESCQQYLLLRSAYVAAPAFEYSPLKKKCTRLIAFFRCPGLFCCTEIGLLNIM